MARIGLRAAYLFALVVGVAIAIPCAVLAGSFQRDFQDLISHTPSGTFVSGLVMLQDQLDRNTLEEQIAAQHLDTRWRRHQYVITTAQALAARTQTNLLQTLEALRQQGRVRSYESFWITNMVEVDALPEVFQTLVRRPDLGTIFVNATPQLRGSDFPNGDPPPVDVLPDNLICVNVQHAWDLGYHGEGRLVALFDTGADGHHPALAAKWRGVQPGVHWWEAWKDPSGNTTFPYDSGIHGTHVLGIMVAKKPDGTAIGVAPSAKWIAAGVLIAGTAQQIIDCYQWAADPDGDPSTIDDVPDVINNSWGVEVGCDQTYWNAIDIVEAAGIVNTIAVSNDGPNRMTVKSPESRATTPTVNFSVGDVNPHTAGYPIAQTSGRGPSPCDSVSIKPEVTAPGEAIYSTLPSNSYGTLSGTSMACPHTSGAAAILRQVNPDLTVDEIKTILMSTATDRGLHGEDNTYGWGIINIGAAVDYAYSTLPKYPPTNLVAASDANNVTLTWHRPSKIYFRDPISKYRLYRSLVGQGFPQNPFAEVSDTSAVVSYHDNGLAWGDYQYVVTAFFTTGESGPSNVAQAHLALSAPQSLVAIAVGDSVGLTWQRPSPIFPAFPLQSYELFRAAVGDSFQANPIATFSDTSRVVEHTDIEPVLGAFHYRVSAVYQSGDRVASNDAQVSISLVTPVNLTAAVVADTVQLAWQRPAHLAPNAEYRLYRAALGDTFPHNPIAVVTDTSAAISYRDGALAWGDYQYAVTAGYQTQQSGRSNTVQAHLGLSAPRNLTAQAFADTVQLRWQRPDPIFPQFPLQSYGVWRAAAGDTFPHDPIATFSDTSLVVTFTNTPVQIGSYRYLVAAMYQTVGNVLSTVVNAQVTLDPPRNLTALAVADTVRLAWERPRHVIRDLPIVSYRVFRAAFGDTFPQSPIATIPDSLGVLAYMDTTGVHPGRFRYYVTALYVSAESGPSNLVEADVEVPPPTNLTATAVGDSVALGWRRPIGIVPTNPLQGYQVFRSAVGDSFPQQPLAVLSDTSAVLGYADRHAPPGSYRYEVIAAYQVSASAPSNQAFATAHDVSGIKDPLATRTAPLRAAPNPFNPTTVIHYRPMSEALLRISIWDLQGTLVRNLVLSASPQKTDQSILWDGRNDAGRRVASGMYFIRMSQGGRNVVCRVTLLK